MNKRLSMVIIAIGVIAIIIGVSTLGASTQLLESNNDILLVHQNSLEELDMLIFVSPQYADDVEIDKSVKSYIKSVKDDIGWEIKIIHLTQENNDYKMIDHSIEMYCGLYDIKACIMVGEDTDTSLGGDSGYMNKPSIVPWFTLGEEDGYEVTEQGIVCQPYIMNICISLLYPTRNLDYQIKKEQIIFAFNKFTNQRTIPYSEDILIFESEDVNTNSKKIYHDLDSFGNLVYKENPTDLEIKNSLINSYSMYYIHGHSNPSGTDLNVNNGGWFSADNLDEINTHLFGADGCYVGGWWSNKTDTNNLDSSIDCLWYGSKIFTSKNVKVMILGLLSQNGFSYPVSFIENGLPSLFEGKTLAESIINQIYLGENIIIGDPTFHYAI